MNNYTGKNPKKVMHITTIFGISVHFIGISKNLPVNRPYKHVLGISFFGECIRKVDRIALT